MLEISGPAQGTTYSVQVVAPPDGLDEAKLRATVEAELAAVDELLSIWRDDSHLARFNGAPAERWVPVPAELVELVARSLEIGRRTDGAFDITVAPLLRLWGFGPEAAGPRHVPGDAAIREARARTGPDMIGTRREPPALRKARAGVLVSLDGIAQGYTVDRLADRLDAAGADRYLVELGGELFGRGRNARGESWTIGVEEPTPGVRRLRGTVGIDGVGMTTSGDYRDFFEADGERYSHTIDPRTGRPADHDLRSVTVIARSAADADGLATALLVLGPDAGLAYAREHDLAALFIAGDDDGYTGTATAAFERYMSRGDKP
ncbi:FAD:protein FMN transferase [Salinisphaera sp. PC39]|uniref:FAD:protein FMN transferase n=1 Tax=Salinisphaera sp. PC39 TaxID=1304156 RepID=UPI0033421E41